jgi:hypothetical protein
MLLEEMSLSLGVDEFAVSGILALKNEAVA